MTNQTPQERQNSKDRGENRAPDTRLQSALRAYGTFVGLNPRALCCCTLMLYFLLIVIGLATANGKPMTDYPLELIWSQEGGKLERGIKVYRDKIGHDGDGSDYLNTGHIIMAVREEDDTANVITKTAMETWSAFNLQMQETVITTHGHDFNYRELCQRGILPDLPPSPMFPVGAPILPCENMTPLMCFKEEILAADPTYQAVFDPIIDQVVPGKITSASLPSINGTAVTDADILRSVAILLNPAATTGDASVILGCYMHSVLAGISSAFYLGTMTWGTQTVNITGAGEVTIPILTKAEGFRALINYEAINKIMYRMSIVRPEASKKYIVDEALDKMARSIHEQAYDTSGGYLELSDLAPFSFEDFEEELGAVYADYIIMGFAFNFFFTAWTTVNYSHPQASRTSVALAGLMLILVSEAAGLFGLYLMLGVQINGTMGLALPILGLGLGLDDMFVLIRYFSNLGFVFMASHTPEEIIGESLCRAGVGTTLTSVCNVVAFCCGAFGLTIPAMSDFCMGAACIALTNYLTNINILLPLLRLEVDRIRRCGPDPHPLTYICHKRTIEEARENRRKSITATSTMEFSKSGEKALMEWLSTTYAPFLNNGIVAAVATVIGITFFIISITFIDNMTLGWTPADLVPVENRLHRVFELLFSTFSLFTYELFFDATDVPANQANIYHTFDALSNTTYVAPVIPPVTVMFAITQQMVGMMVAPMILAAQNITEPTPAMMASAAEGFIESIGLGPIDKNYMNPYTAPYGTLTTNATNFYNVFTPWRRIPTPLEAWVPDNVFFVYADLTGANLQNYDANNHIDCYTMTLLNIKLTTEDKFLEMIEDTHDVIDSSVLEKDTYVFGGITTFWEVFLELEESLRFLLIIDCILIFFATLIFFEGDLTVATITAVSCIMIVIQAYGVTCAFLSFNVFGSAFVLMAMGMSVEFTCHFAAALSTGAGTTVERFSDAMEHTFPALTEGTISTILGVLPLAFHPTQFYIKYLFGIVMIVVGVGVLNGYFLMPAMVAGLDKLRSAMGMQAAPRMSRVVPDEGQ